MDYSKCINTAFCGFRQHRLVIDEFVSIIIIEPNIKPKCGNPWVLCTQTPDTANAQTWISVLEQGWHIGHITVDGLYGSGTAKKRIDYLYEFMTMRGFSLTPAITGIGHDGLAIYSWARENTGHFCCLLLDNPICDFVAWIKTKTPQDYLMCLKAHHLTEQSVPRYAINFIDNLEVFAHNRTPIMHIIDPGEEGDGVFGHTQIVSKRLRELGHTINAISRVSTPNLALQSAIISHIIDAYNQAGN